MQEGIGVKWQLRTSLIAVISALLSMVSVFILSFIEMPGMAGEDVWLYSFFTVQDGFSFRPQDMKRVTKLDLKWENVIL